MKCATHVTFLILQSISVANSIQPQNSAPSFYLPRYTYPRYTPMNYGTLGSNTGYNMGGLLQGFVQGAGQNVQTVNPLLSGMYGQGTQVRSSGGSILAGSPLTSGLFGGYPIVQTNSINQTPLIQNFVGGNVALTGQNNFAVNNLIQLLLSMNPAGSSVVLQHQPRNYYNSGGYFVYIVKPNTTSITTITTTRPTRTIPTTVSTTRATTQNTGTTVRTTPYTGVSTTTTPTTTTTRATTTMYSTLGDYSYETIYPF